MKYLTKDEVKDKVSEIKLLNSKASLLVRDLTSHGWQVDIIDDLVTARKTHTEEVSTGEDVEWKSITRPEM